MPAGTKQFDVTCPGGKTVLSGGYNLSAGDNNTTMVISQPDSNTQWGFRIRNPTGGAKTMTVYLVCANVGS